MRSQGLTVTLRIGGQSYRDLPFENAVDLVRRYTKREQEGCKEHVEKINKDQWIVSFWSEILGNVRPPENREWIAPLSELDSARSAYRGGRNDLASRKFREAVQAYNTVHRKWNKYVNGVQIGAGRAITTMEITITALSTVAGGGAGGNFGKAVMSASLKAWEESCKSTGKVLYGLEDSADIAKIALGTGEAFLGKLVSGVLSDKFLKILVRRLPSIQKLAPHVAKWLTKPGADAVRQKFLADFLSGTGTDVLKDSVKRAARKAAGRKSVSVADFMVLVAKEMNARLLASKSAENAFLSFLENQATAYMR